MVALRKERGGHTSQSTLDLAVADGGGRNQGHRCVAWVAGQDEGPGAI